MIPKLVAAPEHIPERPISSRHLRLCEVLAVLPTNKGSASTLYVEGTGCVPGEYATMYTKVAATMRASFSRGGVGPPVAPGTSFGTKNSNPAKRGEQT